MNIFYYIFNYFININFNFRVSYILRVYSFVYILYFHFLFLPLICIRPHSNQVIKIYSANIFMDTNNIFLHLLLKYTLYLFKAKFIWYLNDHLLFIYII